MSFIDKSIHHPPPFDPLVSILPTQNLNCPQVVRRQTSSEGIQQHFFMSNGIAVNYYTARAKNEKMMIVGCSGFKSDYILQPNQIAELNAQGISIIWMSLPNPERYTGFLPYFNQAAANMMTATPTNEIKEWLNRDVPKIYMGHSTGAQVIFHLLRDNDYFPHLNKMFSGAALSSPYIRCTNAASPFNPSTYAFGLYSWARQNSIPSETLEGKLYLKRYGRDTNPDPDKAFIEPTLGQVRELLRGGKPVVRDAYDPNSNLNNRKFSILNFSGEIDGFSSPPTVRNISRAANMAYHETKGAGHDPIGENNDTFRTLIEASNAMAEGTFNQYAEENGLFLPPRFARLKGLAHQAAAAASPSNALHAT